MNTETPIQRLASDAELEFLTRIRYGALPVLKDRTAHIVRVEPVPTAAEGRAVFRIEWSSGEFTKYSCPQSEVPNVSAE